MFIDRLSLPVPWLPTAVIVEGGDVRARWWGDAHSWPQLDPLPTDVRWRWEKILEVAAWPHASSYYLASRGGDLQCYVAVCGGFANDCRFSVPVLDEGAEPRYSAR